MNQTEILYGTIFFFFLMNIIRYNNLQFLLVLLFSIQ